MKTGFCAATSAASPANLKNQLASGRCTIAVTIRTEPPSSVLPVTSNKLPFSPPTSIGWSCWATSASLLVANPTCWRHMFTIMVSCPAKWPSGVMDTCASGPLPSPMEKLARLISPGPVSRQPPGSFQLRLGRASRAGPRAIRGGGAGASFGAV